MKPKIFITGQPRSGKSTLISKLIEYFSQKDFEIYGFMTPEIRKENKRDGFYVEDINTKKKFPLARVGNYNTKFKLGRYSIFVEDFEFYINELLELLESLEENPSTLFCIDEIGKMELFSKKFQEFIIKLFHSNRIIIATIGEKLKHPIKDYILNLSNLALYKLDQEDQEEIFNEIVSILK